MYGAPAAGQDQGRLLDRRFLGGHVDELIVQLEDIVPAITGLAGNVRPDQFDNATPCAGYRVRDLFDHLIGGASQFAPQLRGEPVGAVPSGLTDQDRPAALKDALAELLDATKAPGAAERTVNLPFGPVPGSVLVRFLTIDGMVHATDLARATDQTYEPDDALTSHVLASAQQLIAPEMRDGDTFAAETPVPDDASSLTKLVAFTGRAI
jgi:uncharacterized protein (TIGR03086 family)